MIPGALAVVYLGYVAVGLTFIYALSGLAVNHIADWDPNFENFEREQTVTTPLPADDQEAARAVQEQVGRMEYAPSFQMGHPAPFELAARLARIAPGGWLPDQPRSKMPCWTPFVVASRIALQLQPPRCMT